MSEKYPLQFALKKSESNCLAFSTRGMVVIAAGGSVREQRECRLSKYALVSGLFIMRTLSMKSTVLTILQIPGRYSHPKRNHPVYTFSRRLTFTEK